MTDIKITERRDVYQVEALSKRARRAFSKRHPDYVWQADEDDLDTIIEFARDLNYDADVPIHFRVPSIQLAGIERTVRTV